MNQSFDVNVDSENEFVHKIIVSGELRRGTKLSGVEWQGLLSAAKSIAEKKKVVFDIQNLTYWDTGGMSDVIGTVVQINKSTKGTNRRAAIIRPKVMHLLALANLLAFAIRKYPELSISQDDIPILENQAQMEKFVEG